MKKRPTDFSQISLLSNEKAKLIYLKNSKENNEHAKLCKSFEKAKHGIRASHGKKKKDLEKRLERHQQDSLNVDDIKSLRKYVGDAREENEFCSQFIESGRSRRTRSSSVLSNKKEHAVTQELKLEARRKFIHDLGENVELDPNEQSKLYTIFPKHDDLNHNSDMLKLREEKDFSSIRFAKSAKVGHNNLSRSNLEETADAKSSKTRSPKVQRENIAKQNHKGGEMLSGLTASSAKPDIVASHSKIELIEKTMETVYAACDKSDENNNCLEENSSKVFDFEIQEKKVCDTVALTEVDRSSSKLPSLESKEPGNGSAFGQQLCEQRKESKKGPVILKRLGPTPNEYDEEVDEENLQDERGTIERQYPRQRKSSFNSVHSDRNPREMFPVSGNDPPARRRRSSWAGPHSVTERLFKREFPERIPHLDRNLEAENGVGRHGLDNCDRASQKSSDSAPNDALDCTSTTEEGKHGCESLEAKRNFFLQKSSSVPLGIGSRAKIYSEEPFYMRPRRLSRRPSWQSIKLSEETLKGLQEIADKAKSETVNNDPEPEPETPLVRILPPITLQSIYAQQCNRDKREQETQELRKQRETHKKIGEEKQIDINLLTDRLKDCRYLRLKKDPSL